MNGFLFMIVYYSFVDRNLRFMSIRCRVIQGRVFKVEHAFKAINYYPWQFRGYYKCIR